jgi:uncharacterized lipoprotein YehR (DUF1307 family)
MIIPNELLDYIIDCWPQEIPSEPPKTLQGNKEGSEILVENYAQLKELLDQSTVQATSFVSDDDNIQPQAEKTLPGLKKIMKNWESVNWRDKA